MPALEQTEFKKLNQSIEYEPNTQSDPLRGSHADWVIRDNPYKTGELVDSSRFRPGSHLQNTEYRVCGFRTKQSLKGSDEPPTSCADIFHVLAAPRSVFEDKRTHKDATPMNSLKWIVPTFGCPREKRNSICEQLNELVKEAKYDSGTWYLDSKPVLCC